MNAQTCRRLRRCHWRRGSIIAAVFSLLTLGTGPGLPHLATADAAIVGWCAATLRPADVWNTLTVDMNVKRQRQTSTGEPTGTPSPTASYRIERSSRSGSWKTVVTVLSVDRGAIYSLSGAITPRPPFPVARIEDDENGTPVRAYDANGTWLRPSVLESTANTSTSPRTTGLQWLDAFVASPAKKTARQLALEKQFGKATKVGTLNRYLKVDGDRSEEVLVDPKVVVPVEANASRGGKRVGHRTFTYGPAPDSALVRTAIHAETIISVDTGDRAVVDTTFSNVCLERK
jgi:hypothetical protein